MRNIIAILLLSFIIACQPTSNDPLVVLREDLATKKSELSKLKSEITTIEEEIYKLDPPTEKPKKLVSTAKVTSKTFERFVEVQGAIESEEVVLASSETGGRLTSVTPKEGSRVSRGQVIASVDLESLTKQRAEVETALSLAKDVYERQGRLWEQKIGTEIQYLQAKNNVERLEKSLETIDFNLKKSSVYAPISGIVDRVFLKAGELAGPGAPIVQILKTSQVKVVADVPERYLKEVRKGQSIRVEFPALDEERNVRISRISPTVDPGNRTFQIEAVMRNSGGKLKPNLLASVFFKEFTQKDVIVVPLNTIQHGIDGASYVFVKETNEDGDFASKVMVEIGESDKGEVIVMKGLKAGDDLIIDGALGLGDQEKIKIQNQKTDING